MTAKLGMLLAVVIAIASAAAFSSFRAGAYPAHDPVLRAGTFALRIR